MPLRVVSGVLLVAVAMSACTSRAPVVAMDPSLDPLPAAAVSGDVSRPVEPSPEPSVLDVATLRCEDNIDTAPPGPDVPVVAGAVALSQSGTSALQTAASGEPDAAGRWFAKAGLLVRAGVAAELVVPAEAGISFSIGWGSPGLRTRRLIVPPCPDVSATGSGWLVFAGGFWVPAPSCVPLLVRPPNREQRLLVGVGAACPGQHPPDTPSQHR